MHTCKQCIKGGSHVGWAAWSNVANSHCQQLLLRMFQPKAFREEHDTGESVSKQVEEKVEQAATQGEGHDVVVLCSNVKHMEYAMHVAVVQLQK